MSFVRLLAFIVLITAAHFSVDLLLNQAQDAGPDVPAGKLRSLSFAPYHDGYSPITRKFPLPEHVQSDVQTIADQTFAIRTYSVRGGMQPTPQFARQYGVDMMMGAWMGDGHPENLIEIQTLIDAARQNSDVVKRVIVGNEVLLRKDMDIDTLIGYIRQVKQAVPQPVTYADVWSSYMQYPQLFNEVDFITIHILPYWEDEPVAIEHAAEHVEKIVQQIEDKARSMGIVKPILIGESGWPAIGRQRGGAVPSVVNEARYIRELIQVANRHGFDYNIVEAFNQPWKSHSEGVVGANWGLLDINREPVFPLTGPVTENPDWQPTFAWSAGLWLLLTAIYFKPLQNLSWSRQLLFLVFGQLFAISLVHLADFLWQTSYTLWQQSYTVLLLAANAALVELWMQRFSSLQACSNNALKNLYMFFLVLATVKSYHIAFDGRYLSFPTEQFAIPALGVIGAMVFLLLESKPTGKETLSIGAMTGIDRLSHWARYCGYALAISPLAVIIGECHGFMSAYDFIQAHPSFSEGLPVALGYALQNTQLLTWGLYAVVVALPFCIATSQAPEQVPGNA
jgi:exo-beta-1,3-glucanase (GH17 family)